MDLSKKGKSDDDLEHTAKRHTVPSGAVDSVSMNVIVDIPDDESEEKLDYDFLANINYDFTADINYEEFSALSDVAEFNYNFVAAVDESVPQDHQTENNNVVIDISDDEAEEPLAEVGVESVQNDQNMVIDISDDEDEEVASSGNAIEPPQCVSVCDEKVVDRNEDEDEDRVMSKEEYESFFADIDGE